jgi:hypothetical protein
VLHAWAVVDEMKDLAREYASEHGAIDRTHSVSLWKHAHGKIGLSDCPSEKVFAEFLTQFKA